MVRAFETMALAYGVLPQALHVLDGAFGSRILPVGHASVAAFGAKVPLPMRDRHGFHQAMAGAAHGSTLSETVCKRLGPVPTVSTALSIAGVADPAPVLGGPLTMWGGRAPSPVTNLDLVCGGTGGT